jgi:hypothetical protein
MANERFAERARGIKRPLKDRLWEKIAVVGPDDCWEWQGALDSGGYGHIVDESGRARKAHRLVMRLSGVEISDLDVCHTCDNRRCCNPRHLFLGTHLDNMRDRDRKGRTVLPPASPGARNSQARLSEAAVDEIRWLHAANHPPRELARAFGVSRSAITLVVNRRTWRHVP